MEGREEIEIEKLLLEQALARGHLVMCEGNLYLTSPISNLQSLLSMKGKGEIEGEGYGDFQV